MQPHFEYTKKSPRIMSLNLDVGFFTISFDGGGLILPILFLIVKPIEKVNIFFIIICIVNFPN